jgi:repressor LexA
MIELTERQRETLQWIVGYLQGNLRPPTLEEIAIQFRIKPSSAFGMVRALQKKGYLDAGDGTARSIRPINLAEASLAAVDTRLRRMIPSSNSLSDIKGCDGAIHVAQLHLGSRPLFIVIVRGDSMRDALIFDGDWVIVRQQSEVDDGDIAVVSHGFEVMLRRLYFGDDGTVDLVPENLDLPVVTVPKDQVTVFGKALAAYRNVI